MMQRQDIYLNEADGKFYKVLYRGPSYWYVIIIAEDGSNCTWPAKFTSEKILSNNAFKKVANPFVVEKSEHELRNQDIIYRDERLPIIEEFVNNEPKIYSKIARSRLVSLYVQKETSRFKRTRLQSLIKRYWIWGENGLLSDYANCGSKGNQPDGTRKRGRNPDQGRPVNSQDRKKMERGFKKHYRHIYSISVAEARRLTIATEYADKENEAPTYIQFMYFFKSLRRGIDFV